MKLYTVSALTKVMEQLPPEKKRFSSVSGEHVCVQLVIDEVGGAPVFGATVRTSAPGAVVYRVGQAPNDLPTRGETDTDYLSTKAGLYPDPLFPAARNAEILYADRKNAYIIKVPTPESGKTKIDFIVTADNLEETASVEVDTFCVRFAEDTHRYTDWIHYDAIAHNHGVRLFDDSFYRVFKSYLTLAVESGVNMLMIPAYTLETDTYIGGDRKTAQLVDIQKTESGYRFDFARLSCFIAFSEQCGIRYFEFPPFVSQWDGAYAIKFLIADSRGRSSVRFGWKTSSVDPEYLEFLETFMDALGDFIRKSGISERCYFHLSDELKDMAQTDKILRLMQKHLYGAHFFDTVETADHPRAGFEDVVALHRCDEGLVQGARITAVYYCWEQGSRRLTNRFLSQPLSRAAVVGAQMYGAGATLLLHWGFNFYNSALSYRTIDPYADTTCAGIYPGGDAFIVYPDRENGCALPSIRLDAMYRAFLAYRLLAAVDLHTPGAAGTFLSREGIRGYTDYPEGFNWYDGFEERLIQLAASKK